MTGPNRHGTALVVGDRGLLITGASGSGKTTLALALLNSAAAAGRFSALVADDQVLVSARAGRLVCAAPPAIAGLVEVRGRSPQCLRNLSSAVIDLAVVLVEADAAPRLSEDGMLKIEGCGVPLLTLAGRNVTGAQAAILSWLALPPFV